MSRKTKIAEFLDAGYQITVTGRHLQVTDAMKDYALEKISKLERLSSRIIDVNVVMDVQKQQQRVEIIMNVNTVIIKSSAATGDMYASIDEATHKLGTQLQKYKEKLQNHHIISRKEIDMNVNVIEPREEELAEINSVIEEENLKALSNLYQSHKVVSRETRPLKKLSAEEAVMHLDLSGDLFLVYLGADNFLKVIYRRNDGNFGIIETESSKLNGAGAL